MTEFWASLSRTGRAGVVGGSVAILMALLIAAWLVFRVEYQVLFSDLKPQDAQAMTAELDRQKIPYKLGDSGTSILVDALHVHSTRLKLMGKDFPLHGAVGFELFNNTDFGMTEFAQKINYQRALQGELTRTILSLAEIRDARVHLALPEQGLFKQASVRPKASINLTLRQGHALGPEQVTGIQRLVAAAVPGMIVQDVTIVDNRGVALTRSSGAEGELDSSGLRLDLKRETENLLSRKAGAVLDKVFGPGQAMVSVDVTLNMEQMRVTTEDVVPSPNRAGGMPTGTVIRERETLRDSAPPLDVRTGVSSRNNGYAQRETDYAVGRRVEQVIGQPGSIRRIHAVVVVRKPLDLQQEEKIQRLLFAAVGGAPERGDTVVVQTLAALASDASTTGALSGPQAAEQVAESTAPGKTEVISSDISLTYARLLALGGLVLVVIAALFVFRKFPKRSSASLSEAQRAAALQRIQGWMQGGAVVRSEQSPGGIKT